MNRCHKILQDIFYSVHARQFDDSIDQLGYMVSPSVLEYCMRQWNDPDAPLVFPSKSINVAVIYARLLEHYFGQPAIEYLQDPALLYGNDRFFRPYPNNKEEYEAMLEHITVSTLLSNTVLSVQKTIEYFNVEFMVGSPEFEMLSKVPKLARKY